LKTALIRERQGLGNLLERKLHPERAAFRRSFHIREKESGGHGIIVDGARAVSRMQEAEQIVKTLRWRAIAEKTNKVTVFRRFRASPRRAFR
jgi:hypothetical protein